MIITYDDKPRYGIINEKCSRLYPGARVRVLRYLKDADRYEVKNTEGEYQCFIKPNEFEWEQNKIE